MAVSKRSKRLHPFETILDSILQLFLKSPSRAIHVDDEGIVPAILFTIQLQAEITAQLGIDRFTELCYVLRDDGYIKFATDENNFFLGGKLTAKGELFISQGGYVGNAERAAFEKRMGTFLQTILVVMTVPVGIFSVLEILKFVYSYFFSQ